MAVRFPSFLTTASITPENLSQTHRPWLLPQKAEFYLCPNRRRLAPALLEGHLGPSSGPCTLHGASRQTRQLRAGRRAPGGPAPGKARARPPSGGRGALDPRPCPGSPRWDPAPFPHRDLQAAVRTQDVRSENEVLMFHDRFQRWLFPDAGARGPRFAPGLRTWDTVSDSSEKPSSDDYESSEGSRVSRCHSGYSRTGQPRWKRRPR